MTLNWPSIICLLKLANPPEFRAHWTEDPRLIKERDDDAAIGAAADDQIDRLAKDALRQKQDPTGEGDSQEKAEFIAAREFFRANLQGIGPVEITGASWREMKRGMTSDPIMLADGLGHESEKRWQKRKGESPDLPQVKSPSAGDSETASAVYDLILGESGDEVNEPGLHIVILGVRKNDGSALDQPGPQ